MGSDDASPCLHLPRPHSRGGYLPSENSVEQKKDGLHLDMLTVDFFIKMGCLERNSFQREWHQIKRSLSQLNVTPETAYLNLLRRRPRVVTATDCHINITRKIALKDLACHFQEGEDHGRKDARPHNHHTDQDELCANGCASDTGLAGCIGGGNRHAPKATPAVVGILCKFSWKR